jgi:hypothetical protein
LLSGVGGSSKSTWRFLIEGLEGVLMVFNIPGWQIKGGNAIDVPGIILEMFRKSPSTTCHYSCQARTLPPQRWYDVVEECDMFLAFVWLPLLPGGIPLWFLDIESKASKYFVWYD